MNGYSDLPLAVQEGTDSVCITDFNHVKIIDELRSQGKRVTIHHKRRYTQGTWDSRLSPKGGQTVVCIMDNDNVGKVGVINCYHKDTFCKKQGVKRALAKALGVTLTEPPKKEKPCRS